MIYDPKAVSTRILPSCSTISIVASSMPTLKSRKKHLSSSFIKILKAILTPRINISSQNHRICTMDEWIGLIFLYKFNCALGHRRHMYNVSALIRWKYKKTTRHTLANGNIAWGSMMRWSEGFKIRFSDVGGRFPWAIL